MSAETQPVLARAGEPSWPRPWRGTRAILPPQPGGWTGVRLGEWVLRGGWFSDVHPHEEVSYVLEGELTVRIGSGVHTLGPGDALLVPAHTKARYEAAGMARILFVYGPNPEALPSPPPSEGSLSGETS